MNRTARVALCTLTMDRLEYTRQMLDSLAGSTSVPFDHFVIDNGSTDGTVEFLKANADRFKAVRLNPENVGLSVGWNQGLDLMGRDYDYIVKVDNDCKFLDFGWLEALIEVCEARGRKIVLSPRVEGLGPGLEGGHPRREWVTCADRRLGLTNHVGGICCFAPAEAYDRFRYGKTSLHGTQDVRFSLYARFKLGYELGYVEDVRVWHIDDTTGQGQRHPEYWAKRIQDDWRVHGENGLVTRLMWWPRRLVFLYQMDRGGLIEGGLPRYLAGRMRHKARRLLGIATDDEFRYVEGIRLIRERAMASREGGQDETGSEADDHGAALEYTAEPDRAESD